MSKAGDKTFWSDFRNFFLRGLVTLLPTVLTIVLLFKCFEFVQDNIGAPITERVVQIIVLSTDKYPYMKNSELEEDIQKYMNEVEPVKFDKDNPKDMSDIRLWKLRRQWNRFPRSLVGFGLAIILVYISGRLLASFIGRKFWQLFESTVQRIPGFKQIYPYIKQVTDYLFGSERKKLDFSRVVAVQYPRKGLWSLGLVTGAGFKHIGEQDHEEYLTIFIPSSPTPITGYIIHAKKNEVIDLPITIEEALRFTVSGGVIVPTHQALPTQRFELKQGPSIDDNDIKDPD